MRTVSRWPGRIGWAPPNASFQAFVSAIDLSLALVILFLLGAITVRALVFLVEQSRAAPPPVE